MAEQTILVEVTILAGVTTLAGVLAAMVFEQIEKVKQEYTDKYVVVDGQRAELARFKDLVGQVKTVNMSGRALVEFMDYHLNIGWFDIDLDYLKVVDKPAPKPVEAKKPAAKKPAAKKPAAATEKKLSPLEMARQGDGKKKSSTADVLAALRGGDGKPGGGGAKPSGGGKPAAKPAEAKAPPAKSEPEAAAPTPEPEPTPPAAEAASPGAAGAVDRSSMSVAEMVAYCREKDA